MSCSARLPVYTLMIAAFIPHVPIWAGLLRVAGADDVRLMYLIGIVVAAVVALVLKRTLLRGAPPPFVMELPAYKWPSPRVVLLPGARPGWAFVYRAGTMIFAVLGRDVGRAVLSPPLPGARPRP